MLAAISTVGQHPRGLGPHVANLQWALDRSADIYVFTFREWGLTAPEGVRLVEAEGDPFHWKEFWDEDIREALLECPADHFLFSQQDTFFNHKLLQLLDDHKIILSDEDYGLNIYKDGEFVYPRLWEGGMIVPGHIIRQALEDGISVGGAVVKYRFSERGYCSHMKAGLFDLCDAPETKGVNGILGRIQLWFEFTMYCLDKGHPVEQLDLVSHFNSVETIHRMYPDLYENGDIAQIEDVKKSPAKFAGAFFMYYLTDVIPMTDDLKTVFRSADSRFVEHMLKLNTEWMTDAEKTKVEQVKQLIVRMF